MKRSTTIALAAVAAIGAAALALPVIAQQAPMPFAGMMGAAAMHGGMPTGMASMMGVDTQHMTDQMAKFDTDADGTLSAEEIAAAIKSQLATYDTDANGTLSLAEFTTMHAEVQAEQLAQMNVRAFQMHDADGDAQVTEAELAAMAENMGQMFGTQAGVHGRFGAWHGGAGGFGMMRFH